MKTIVTELSEDEEDEPEQREEIENENENEPDEEATVISEKKPLKKVEMKKPGGLKISLGDDDEGSDELIEDQPTNNQNDQTDKKNN